MPVWAAILESLGYALFPVFIYYCIKYWMTTSKFDRTYDIEEGVNSWGRVDELRSINREIAHVGKYLLFWAVTLLFILGAFAHLYAIPHAKGLI